MKIGVLLWVSLWMGVFCVGVNVVVLEQVDVYVGVVGFVFQVVDDIFDVIVDIVMLGKIVGKDEVNDKLIYVFIFGLDKVRVLVDELYVIVGVVVV